MAFESCPYCSTRMESYATVCPGCGAEAVLISEDRFSVVRLILVTLLLSGVSIVIAGWVGAMWVFYVGIGVSLLFGFAYASIDAKYEWQR